MKIIKKLSQIFLIVIFLTSCKTLLKKDGKLIFEISEKQKNMVTQLLLKNGFYLNKVCKNLNSYPRVIVSTKIF